jgi:hypothetical protein
MEQRWRYADRTGRPIWLPFDPTFLCVYCERPVTALSMGGPAVCPECDCGYSDGKRWDTDTCFRLIENAERRFDNMVSDPLWDEYETAHQEGKLARKAR